MTDKQKKLSLLLIALLVLVKFVFAPWIEWLNETATDIGRLTETRDKFAEVTERGQQLKNLQQQIDSNYRTLEQSWINETSANASVKILRHIQSVATKLGIELKNSDVGSMQEGDVPSYPVSIFFEATPEQSMMFIYSLESSSPKMELAKMSIFKPNFKASKVRISLGFIVIAAPERS